MKGYTVEINKIQLHTLLRSLSGKDAREAVDLLQAGLRAREARRQVVDPETALASLPFQIRTLRVFKRFGLGTVQDIQELGLKKLQSRKGVGIKTIQEIKEIIGDAEAP
jgi:hypothetical protein